MKRMSAGLVVAAFVLAAVPAAARYKYDSPSRQQTTMVNCLYATSEAVMLAYPGCAKTMIKLGIGDTELRAMRTCKWMPVAAQRADASCASLAARFPMLFTMARGA